MGSNLIKPPQRKDTLSEEIYACNKKMNGHAKNYRIPHSRTMNYRHKVLTHCPIISPFRGDLTDIAICTITVINSMSITLTWSQSWSNRIGGAWSPGVFSFPSPVVHFNLMHFASAKCKKYKNFVTIPH